MSIITDRAIRSAISGRRAERAGRVELRDPGEKHGGRLVVVVRWEKTHVLAEFYAVWHRGKRIMAKLGAYPSMSLKQARKLYREEYQPVILKGEDPIGARGSRARGGASLGALGEAYCVSLKGRGSEREVRQLLLGPTGILHAIGAGMRACDVRKQHVIPHLARIHEGGRPASANKKRNVLHAMFNYGINVAGSYYDPAGATDWGLDFNPISAIRPNKDAIRARDRFLSDEELVRFWRWLEAPQARQNPIRDAVRIIIATGQRACEVLAISAEHYDSGRGLAYWPVTKNGRPHHIPLPRQAVDILASLRPNAAGRYFPRVKDLSERACTYAVARLVRRYCDETGAEPFEARDLRRTWKTAAGAAGISKEVRDRLQNHALSDVSSRHYDRWDYMPEKREGMRVWEDHLQRLLDADTLPQQAALLPSTLPLTNVLRLKSIMGGKAWRAAAQAAHRKDWIGHAVSRAFDLKRTDGRRNEVPRLVSILASHGVIRRQMVWCTERRSPYPAYVLNSSLLAKIEGGGGEYAAA